ncbi:MAG: hypothetical protein NTY01_06770, partial [Verrucomicrobia bacterium]|nr:hypothetical protein [Verrucomicrobiota bacterium]
MAIFFVRKRAARIFAGKTGRISPPAKSHTVFPSSGMTAALLTSDADPEWQYALGVSERKTTYMKPAVKWIIVAAITLSVSNAYAVSYNFGGDGSAFSWLRNNLPLIGGQGAPPPSS